MSNASPDNVAPDCDKAKAAAHTPGPWRWEINLTARQIQLCGGDPKAGFGAYDHTVMDFVRWGMSGAQPRFLDSKATLLTEASTYAEVVEGREHHKSWFQTLSHPDARLIAAAPDLLEALKAVDYLLNELADERTPANVEMTPAEAALVAFRKHTARAINRAESGQ